jgi:uncharacterized lipoprotein YajG
MSVQKKIGIGLILIFLSGCVGNKIVLTYPEPPTIEPVKEILDRDIWVLSFGDQRKNSAVGLKREGHDPEEWIKIRTDTSIVDLVTQGVKKELIHAGYRVVGDERSNILITGEIRKFESHYIVDQPPFVLAMAQLLVTVVAYDKEKDNMQLIYQKEFLAGADEKESFVYSPTLFIDALTKTLQRVCRKIASSKDLLAAMRDYPKVSILPHSFYLTRNISPSTRSK